MRRLDDGALRFSPSDLMAFAGCTHRTALDLLHLMGEVGPGEPDDAAAVSLQAKGDAHEAAYLARLKTQDEVVEIAHDQSFENALLQTERAIANGAPYVFQAALAHGVWGGWSDFLRRIEAPSDLGSFSYEVIDTKLKRSIAPSHVLQISIYSTLLASIQGVLPERGHVVLGDGTEASFRIAEHAGYARTLAEALERFSVERPITRPIPCGACALCPWRVRCHDQWEAEDSVFRVANITRSQVVKLKTAGVTTMDQLAARNDPVPRLADPTRARLQAQAGLQHARKTGAPSYIIREPELGRGFALLPPPDPDDVFYDIEGYPHHDEGGALGLEYLHGVLWHDGTDEASEAIWAHDRAEEAAALETLLALLDQRLTRSPAAHVYHYANYEIAALRRLAMRHGTGEALLDGWLRAGRFVDLYAVVRGGVLASEPSYSIKDMEALYDFSRSEEVATGGDSILAYECWLDGGGQHILDAIKAYNRVDCASTRALRDWLLDIRPPGPWPSTAGDGATASPRELERMAQEAEILQALRAEGLEGDRASLLRDLLLYHRREAKPSYWAIFDSLEKDSETLFEDLDYLGGLIADGAARPVRQSMERDYLFPEQETKLRENARCSIRLGEAYVAATITHLDRGARQITLRIGRRSSEALADRVDLLPAGPISSEVIEAALRALAQDQMGTHSWRSADALLSRALPRLTSPALEIEDGSDPVAAITRAVLAMDGTVLPIQGPPGTGKTHVSARAIHALVREGKRVAVSSNSHEAIRNLLEACVDAMEDGPAGSRPRIAQKAKAGTEAYPPPYDLIGLARGNDDPILAKADIVGGTAWLFCRPEMRGRFSHLFVDEAGQVSLANAAAMSGCAENLVLVGDPAQLPQVVQGAHPHPANLSSLDWLRGDAVTLPSDRGLFLPVTRRLNPASCAYVSDQFYEGRLRPHPLTEVRSVDVQGFPSSGVHLVAIEHEGRSQRCPEEVEAICDLIDRLLDGTWVEHAGEARSITREDVIVVAPYNLQVLELARALPGIRVGTVDRFQGQEAAVTIVSMTASSATETSRGLAFLLSRERLNVAVSRGMALGLVVASPSLLTTPCSSVAEMRLVGALCALPRW